MFFKDENDIDVIQMGTGDVMVTTLEWKATPTKNQAGIAFAPCEPGNIARPLSKFKGKIDYKAGVKLKILFSDAKAIDVVINQLKMAKAQMLTA